MSMDEMPMEGSVGSARAELCQVRRSGVERSWTKPAKGTDDPKSYCKGAEAKGGKTPQSATVEGRSHVGGNPENPRLTSTVLYFTLQCS